jgi:hypothetical protein
MNELVEYYNNHIKLSDVPSIDNIEIKITKVVNIGRQKHGIATVRLLAGSETVNFSWYECDYDETPEDFENELLTYWKKSATLFS